MHKKKSLCWGCGKKLDSQRVNYCSSCFDEFKRIRKEHKQKGIGTL